MWLTQFDSLLALFNVFVGSVVNLSSITSRCSGNQPEFYICKSDVNRDHTTRCTKCCMPLKLTSKCHANTFVKVDTQIEKSADGLSLIWKGVLTQSSVDYLLKHSGKLTFPAVSKMCNVTSCPSMSTLCWYQLSVNKILISVVFKNLRSSALLWRFSLFSLLKKVNLLSEKIAIRAFQPSYSVVLQ